MSEIAERLNLRDLPPVEPIDPPERLSMTLLRFFQRCPRSAYLYRKHGGGAPAHQLHFGSAFHAFAEKALLELIGRGEPTLYAAQEGEDTAHVQRQVASLTAAMVDEVLRDRPELVVPIVDKAHSVDHLRQLAYHWAIAYDTDPGTVVGVERKFVLDLEPDREDGWQLVGKIDVAALPTPTIGAVEDYKSSFPPDAPEFEGDVQTKLYAALLVFGQPVDDADVRQPGVGEHLQQVNASLVFPRVLRRDGSLYTLDVTYTRQELRDFLSDLRLLGERVRQALTDWKWPAVAGSHCSECPCEPECPLPAELRDHAGEINSVEQASEALEWVDRQGDRVKAVKEECKRFAKLHGPVRYGDVEYGFSVVESQRTDWDELELAVERSAQYGEPFELGHYRKPQKSMRFTSRRLSAEEVAEAAQGDRRASLDERFGAEPPF